MSDAAAQAMFKFFDDNGDNGLSFDELKEGMQSVGSKFTDAEVRNFFDKVGSSSIYASLISLILPATHQPSPSSTTNPSSPPLLLLSSSPNPLISSSYPQLTLLSSQYDKDKNGIIDFNEFLGLCIDINTNDSEKAVATLFATVDKDNNR